jgi:cyclopropane fatty-acyl-phospholipid synthase-like methyltransferase
MDHAKIEFAKRLGVCDELYASDVRTFSYPKPFDAVIAVEAVHGFLGAELLGRLEGLAKRGGLIVLALPALPRSIATSELAQQGYVVYRYFLRGFILVRVDKAEVRTTPSGLERSRAPNQAFSPNAQAPWSA